MLTIKNYGYMYKIEKEREKIKLTNKFANYYLLGFTLGLITPV